MIKTYYMYICCFSRTLCNQYSTREPETNPNCYQLVLEE